MIDKVYVFPREADAETPAGLTISKNPELPKGLFELDEYHWEVGDITLWFLAQDEFTADEREFAYRKALTIVIEERHAQRRAEKRRKRKRRRK